MIYILINKRKFLCVYLYDAQVFLFFLVSACFLTLLCVLHSFLGVSFLVVHVASLDVLRSRLNSSYLIPSNHRLSPRCFVLCSISQPCTCSGILVATSAVSDQLVFPPSLAPCRPVEPVRSNGLLASGSESVDSGNSLQRHPAARRGSPQWLPQAGEATPHLPGSPRPQNTVFSS